MSNQTRYREFAEACDRLAHKLPDEDGRLLEPMALAWRALAREEERLDELVEDAERVFATPLAQRLATGSWLAARRSH